MQPQDVPSTIAPDVGGAVAAAAATVVWRGDDMRGQRVGEYTLVRQIGAGGMGAVFEARQERPNRLVALKLMKSALTSEQARHRFLREAEVLGRLLHPNIAQVYEAGTQPAGVLPVPFIVMELVQGGACITEYARAHRLDMPRRLALFVDVCDAVDHAHRAGVAHCDLKPGNVLIDQRGQPKVIDFGLARALEAHQPGLTLQTQSSVITGTPQYMSPEQFETRPDAPIGPASDVYSLGVVLYELVCGQLPYAVARGELWAAARVIREVPPTRPRDVEPSVPRDLETIILRCLSKEPSRRYASGRQS